MEECLSSKVHKERNFVAFPSNECGYVKACVFSLLCFVQIRRVSNQEIIRVPLPE